MSRLLQVNDSVLELKNYNNDFLILKSEKKETLSAIGKAIFQQQFDFVDEVIVTEVEICLKLNGLFNEAKIDFLEKLDVEENKKQDIYKLPIYFADHEDWTTVESSTGFLKKEIIAKLMAADFTIAMFGFLPGFIYLDGLDPTLYVPRKTIPAKYVKANSIAIGGKYLGLYAIDSPGGWHVIGKMPIPILKIPDLPPVDLNLGDKIKLHPIDEIEYENLLQKSISIKEYNA